MGSFTRTGSFKDRAAFVAGLKGKIARLKDGALRGMEETWTAGPPEGCTIAGFGVKVVFTIGEGEWSCEAAIPSWLPIPQSAIEDKFDQEFAELKGL
jgi:hypothetical protein